MKSRFVRIPASLLSIPLLLCAARLSAQALEVLTVALPDYDARMAPYGATLFATGGSGSYPLWNFTGLPAGLAGGSAYDMGSITGSVSAGVPDGVYPVLVTVTDSLGAAASVTLQLRVYATEQILTATLPDGALGEPYGPAPVRAVGGGAGYQVSLGAGALPPGVILSGGSLSGTPSQLGTYNFTLTYGTAARNYTVKVVRETAPNYWVRRGLSGGQMGQLFFSPKYATDRVVIALGKRTVHYSDDGGYFWKLLPFDLEYYFGDDYLPYSDAPVWVGFNNAFDGRPGTAAPFRAIMIATESGGVFYLPDYLGSTYYRLNDGLPTTNGLVRGVQQVEFAPYFNANSKMYLRQRWVEAGPVEREALYAGTFSYTPEPSITWTPVSAPGMRVREFHAAETGLGHDLFLISYLGTDPDGLYRSTDSGASWLRVAPVSYDIGNKIGLFSLAHNYLGNSTLAFADLNGIYVSQDRGDNWQLHPAGGTLADLCIARRPTGLRIYASTKQQLLSYSDDLGVTFTPAGTLGMPTLEFSGRFAVSPDHQNDQTLIAIGKADVGYYRSENGGVSWGPADGGLFAQTINQVVYAPDYATSGKIFVASNGGVYYTVNRGRTWRNASLPAGFGDPVLALAISPNFAADQTLFAGRGSTLLRSTDGGKTFSVRYTFGQLFTEFQRRDLIQLSPAYSSDQTLFVRSGGGYLMRSKDGGATFSRQGWCASCQPAARYVWATGFRVSPGYATDHAVFVTEADDGNYISTNADASAAVPDYAPDPAIPPLSMIRTGRGPALPPDYNHATGTAGTSSATLLWHCARSTDRGAGYTPVPDANQGYYWGCASYEGDLYAVPQAAPGDDYPTLFSTVRIGDASGEFPGLYYSYDDGLSLQYHYPPANAFEEIRALAIAPDHLSSREIIVGTDSGLWFGVVSAYGGIAWTPYAGDDPFGRDVVAAAQDPNNFEGSFVANSYGMVFHSPDDGDTVNWLYEGWPEYPPAVSQLYATGTPTVLLAATTDGIWRRTDFSASGSWSQTGGAGTWCREFTAVGARIQATCPYGSALVSDDQGGTWAPASLSETGLVALDWNNDGGFNSHDAGMTGPRMVSGSTAALWALSGSLGPRWSTDNGQTWTAAPGNNDYTAPAGQSWQVVRALGINAASGGREVLIGSSAGLWKSEDGGDTWRAVDGPGSGLEATSRNVTAMLVAPTPMGTSDLLVGVSGATTGGVYLSGDGGRHWTQVNQGFDPASLSISTLARTSCAGCPVQYYSGTYGGGLYTRTITVLPPPSFPNTAKYCFAGGGSACMTGSTANCDNARISGPSLGGTAFKLCGSGFMNGAVVEFNGIRASGCQVMSGSVITCTGTPPHPPGAAIVTVRNPDTRSSALATMYSYTDAGSRVGGGLRVVRDFDDAVIHWNCPSTGGSPCTAASPARVFRAQNAAFTLFMEIAPGGAAGTQNGCTAAGGNNSCLRQPGYMASERNYFWRVE